MKRSGRYAYVTGLALLLVAIGFGSVPSARGAAVIPDAAKVTFDWGVRIPLRDGIHLNATVYRPQDQVEPAPCVFTLTPYVSDAFHDRGIYFAAHGLPFILVDVRGRNNSEGVFQPFIQEAKDGYDVVEWLARQPYCNGKVAMWGGSYGGYDQWATAKEFPPHLSTIVPVAAARPGVSVMTRNGILQPSELQWLTIVSGRAVQWNVGGDEAFWAGIYRRWFESGRPFNELDRFAGNRSTVFQDWVAHPHPDPYWDSFNPTSQQYARFSIPILTITAVYDGEQQGALTHYREYMKNAPTGARARHFLIIGPWDHSGTRTPRPEVGGLPLGPASLVDLPKLHLEWYAWTMQNGPKPQFLRQPVSYYVMGAEKWRYAASLEAVTAHSAAYFLHSKGNPDGVLQSGSINAQQPARSENAHDHYVYDPHDISGAALEGASEPEGLIDRNLTYSAHDKQLVYDGEPFATATQVSGFFKLSIWLSIDQPDTDFSASVYEIRADGSRILLARDSMRARYRESIREPRLIHTKTPLRYDFSGFNFTSRQIARGSRLRLVIGPINSIYSEKNYNSGGVVAEESMQEARAVIVTLYHDRTHPSALYVPLGPPESPDELTAPAAALSTPAAP